MSLELLEKAVNMRLERTVAAELLERPHTWAIEVGDAQKHLHAIGFGNRRPKPLADAVVIGGWIANQVTRERLRIICEDP